MTRFTIIIMTILMANSFLFALIEYETVGAMPTGHEVVDYFDFNGDGVDELVLKNESQFLIYNLEMILQQTYNINDFSLHFPAQTDTLLIPWHPNVWDTYPGTYFFRWQNEAYVAVGYNVYTYYYWEDTGYEEEYNGHGYYYIDFLCLSDLSLISHTELFIGNQSSYDGESRYFFSSVSGLELAEDRVIVSLMKKAFDSDNSGDSNDIENRVYTFNISGLGQPQIFPQNTFTSLGQHLYFANISDTLIYALDYRKSDGYFYDYEIIQEELGYLRVSGGITEVVLNIWGRETDWEGSIVFSDSIPKGGSIIPENQSIDNITNPLFCSLFYFHDENRYDLKFSKYNVSFQDIELQTTESFNSIEEVQTCYSNLFEQNIFFLTCIFNSVPSLRIYTFSDITLRGEYQFPEIIKDILEPGDGYCYLVGENNLYRITNIEVANDENKVPVQSLNLSNYPNPFNPETTFSYNLAKPSKVFFNIYNVKGQLVRELVNENQQTGSFEILWNGTDSNGKAVGSGVYLYKLETNNQIQTGKAVLLK
ncbi:MAG: T9SS type A sorting domain-containing protein [Candidatus Cloacimonetes bacterium]|nr:T9SS type A sorting domain-containing protein [Candidatus Cloacimonadota bacterium]